MSYLKLNKNKIDGCDSNPSIENNFFLVRFLKRFFKELYFKDKIINFITWITSNLIRNDFISKNKWYEILTEKNAVLFMNIFKLNYFHSFFKFS